jgi:hypothetical protein
LGGGRLLPQEVPTGRWHVLQRVEQSAKTAGGKPLTDAEKAAAARWLAMASGKLKGSKGREETPTRAGGGGWDFETWRRRWVNAKGEPLVDVEGNRLPKQEEAEAAEYWLKQGRRVTFRVEKNSPQADLRVSGVHEGNGIVEVYSPVTGNVDQLRKTIHGKMRQSGFIQVDLRDDARRHKPESIYRAVWGDRGRAKSGGIDRILVTTSPRNAPLGEITFKDWNSGKGGR